jgi:cation/acetate symporter
MLYHPTTTAIGIFLFFTLGVLALSFYLGKRAKSAAGYFAAHSQIPWLVNGLAFAGDYLSAASFLGICGMIAFYGYDGFLYSIGYLAGWVVALFVIAEPIRRLGKFTFADAVDAKFQSRGVKLAAAVSTLVVSILYLIPQMVGAGALIKPLLGFEHWQGVLIVGVVVITIVVSAGMVSTTYVQFIKGALLILFCFLLVLLVLGRGLHKKPDDAYPRTVLDNAFAEQVLAQHTADDFLKPAAKSGWTKLPYVRLKHKDGGFEVWRAAGVKRVQIAWDDTQTPPKPVVIWPGSFTECQVVTRTAAGVVLINGLPQSDTNDLRPGGYITHLADDKTETGPLGPIDFLSAFSDATIATVAKEDIAEADGSTSTVYYTQRINGEDLMVAGGSPHFKTLSLPREKRSWKDQLNFISLMLALFCGTASLPHILIRYYTVKDASAARKSTVVGILAIGFFYVLTLYLGLGAMTSGALDVTDQNMSAPLLARTFGQWWFAVICAIAFTTVLGTVSGLIIASAGAVAHDIIANVLRRDVSDSQKVRYGKLASIVVGIVAMALGIVFKNFNVSFLVGWAFSVAASANLPALIMLLFWPRASKRGITVGIITGLATSVGWILLSADACTNLYKLPAASALVPFNQPGIVTIPLGFIVIVAVSLMTSNTRPAKPYE